MVRTVCSFPDETVTDKELASHLEAADINGNGTFEEDEIAQVVETLRKQIAAQAQALIDEAQLDLEAQATPAQLQQSTSLLYASRQERKNMIDAWQIMYCGGAPPVDKTLEGVAEKFDIPLN